MEWMPEGPRSLLLIVGIALAIPTVKSLGSRWELTRAIVPEDGSELVVRNPHPEFAREAVALGARQLSDRVNPVGWWKRREAM
ncbi:hypothetical protein EF834_13625 [Rhodococcus spongiicola]|uniref:Uncharacterized protein n=1 Tax=Rhodococcus spongiicola TaxID=2487352 RepID=A0A3S3ACS1_9NOCA|nr:hypothetical protein EF834_13625 [Rhodococcus spongiicola]